jgi:hypothetical protein
MNSHASSDILECDVVEVKGTFMALGSFLPPRIGDQWIVDQTASEISECGFKLLMVVNPIFPYSNL